MNTPSKPEDLRAALIDYLAGWELRRFDSDAEYFAYQRATLPPAALTELTTRAQRKHDRPGDLAAEQAFYDLAARPDILTVLYSQRYEYFLVVGAAVAARIGSARRVLDFGCGVGVLTLFYATRYPETRFLGVDRSAASIEAATRQAARLGLTNVRFTCTDLDRVGPQEQVDLILSTHALVQAEQEPGLPSVSWETFARADDALAQAEFERRTGLQARLDRLVETLTPDGRFIVFEKTRQLARRVPLQRALAARGLGLLERPVPLRYQLVEEVAEDGPLFHMVRETARAPSTIAGVPVEWDEMPECQPGEGRYQVSGPAADQIRRRWPDASIEREDSWHAAQLGQVRVEVGLCPAGLAFLFLTTASGFRGIVLQPQGAGSPAQDFADALDLVRGMAEEQALARQWGPPDSSIPAAEAPLYENHAPTAQAVWMLLPDRQSETAMTFQEAGGRILHIELGRAAGLAYLYWATTFDERQLVLMEPGRAELLKAYYAELTSAGRDGGAIILEG